jgi:hypothetical protein
MAFPDLDVKDFTAGTAKVVKGFDLGSSKLALAHALVDASGNQIGLPTAPLRASGLVTLKDITLTADTSIMTNADIIADTQLLNGAFRANDVGGWIRSISVFDPDDNTPFSFYIGLHRTSTSLGSENSGITISDANAAAGIIQFVPFTAGDCIDLINGRLYQRENLCIPVMPPSGTDDLYVSMVCLVGTPTFGGGSLPVVLGIEQA